MAQDINSDTAVLSASQSPPEAISKEGFVGTDPTLCVICLETVSERAVALPCTHDCFDFPCLGNWLVKHKTCPLCKREVEKLQYEFNGASESKIFHLPPAEPDEVSHSGPTHRSSHRQYPYRRVRRPQSPSHAFSTSATQDHQGLERRRHVYRNQLFSLHVGTNRVSRYQDLYPRCFRGDETLLSRARKWIRRELQAFDFLNPNSTDHGGERRRASNAEFLLEYIIAILKTTDIKGSAGHAQELLKDFLGRDNARLFLHELQAWLRSPYQNLTDWDRAVQYGDSMLGTRDAAVIQMGRQTKRASAQSFNSFPPQLEQSPPANCHGYQPD